MCLFLGRFAILSLSIRVQPMPRDWRIQHTDWVCKAGRATHFQTQNLSEAPNTWQLSNIMYITELLQPSSSGGLCVQPRGKEPPGKPGHWSSAATYPRLASQNRPGASLFLIFITIFSFMFAPDSQIIFQGAPNILSPGSWLEVHLQVYHKRTELHICLWVRGKQTEALMLPSVKEPASLTKKKQNYKTCIYIQMSVQSLVDMSPTPETTFFIFISILPVSTGFQQLLSLTGMRSIHLWQKKQVMYT